MCMRVLHVFVLITTRSFYKFSKKRKFHKGIHKKLPRRASGARKNMQIKIYLFYFIYIDAT